MIERRNKDTVVLDANPHVNLLEPDYIPTVGDLMSISGCKHITLGIAIGSLFP